MANTNFGERWLPGLGTVLIAVLVIGAVAHFLIGQSVRSDDARAHYLLQEAVIDHCDEAAKTIEEILIENS